MSWLRGQDLVLRAAAALLHLACAQPGSHARRYARNHGTRYEDLNLIVCHLGGGISIAAHDHGEAIDANNALDGEDRSPSAQDPRPQQTLSVLLLWPLASQDQLVKKVSGEAGIIAHLGTNDMLEGGELVLHGDKHAELILNAMIWNVASVLLPRAQCSRQGRCHPPHGWSGTFSVYH